MGNKSRDKRAAVLPPAFTEKKAQIPRRDILNKKPKWSFRNIDWDFSKQIANACSAGRGRSSGQKVECCFHLLSEKLRSFETMTWGEITKKANHESHFLDLDDLKAINRDAYERFSQLSLTECVDEPFSFRLQGGERLWGVVLSDGTFEMLWYDPDHRIWPSS